MKLKLKDRFAIQGLLSLTPIKQGFLFAMNIASIRNKVEITPEDEVEYEMVENEKGTTWNGLKDTGKEIEFTEPQLKIIRESIISLKDSKDLVISVDEANTFLKFIDIKDIEP